MGDLMKKIIIILFILSGIFIQSKKGEEVLIPDRSIRFRVIAYSNDIQDRNNKLMIKERIEKEVYDIIGEEKDINKVK